MRYLFLLMFSVSINAASLGDFADEACKGSADFETCEQTVKLLMQISYEHGLRDNEAGEAKEGAEILNVKLGA